MKWKDGKRSGSVEDRRAGSMYDRVTSVLSRQNIEDAGGPADGMSRGPRSDFDQRTSEYGQRGSDSAAMEAQYQRRRHERAQARRNAS